MTEFDKRFNAAVGDENWTDAAMAYHDLAEHAVAIRAALLAARREGALLAAFDKHRDLIAHIRPGRNRIGIETGGWLVCKTLDGPEEHVRTFREAVELACKALGITAALAATPERDTQEPR